MASITTVVTDSSATSRMATKELLFKLREHPALAFLVFVIAVCAILFVGVLLYLIVMFIDKSNVSVSLTDVTSDAVGDTVVVEVKQHQTTLHGYFTLTNVYKRPAGSTGTTAESATADDVSSSTDKATALIHENLTITAEMIAQPTAAEATDKLTALIHENLTPTAEIIAQPTAADDVSSSTDKTTALIHENLTITAEMIAQPTAAEATDKVTVLIHENLTLTAEIIAQPTPPDDVSSNDTTPTDNHIELTEYANESIATSATSSTPADRTEEAFVVTALADLVTFTETMNQSYDLVQHFSKMNSQDITVETPSLSNDSSSLTI